LLLSLFSLLREFLSSVYWISEEGLLLLPAVLEHCDNNNEYDEYDDSNNSSDTQNKAKKKPDNEEMKTQHFIALLALLVISQSLHTLVLTQTVVVVNVDPSQDLSAVVSTTNSNNNNAVFIQLSKGSYRFSSAMSLSSGQTVTMKGVSKRETVLDCGHNKQAFSVTKGSRLILQDLTIQHCNYTKVSIWQLLLFTLSSCL